MTSVYTHEIQTLDDGEIYTANIWENGDGWNGWIQEFPEVKCRENTKEALLQTLELRLREVLAAHADAWDKQMEADVEAGKFDAIAERVIADFDAGKCKDLALFLAQHSPDAPRTVLPSLEIPLFASKNAKFGSSQNLSDLRAYTYGVL